MSPIRASLRTHATALRSMLVFTAVLGVLYPAVMLLVGLAMPWQASGSPVRDARGTVVGSALIGQSFAAADGTPAPEWFQSRPSASGSDAMASGGTNLGPENTELRGAIQQRRDAGGATADALTSSGSGLDPHITPANALAQVDRVAAARGLAASAVRALVESKIQGRDLGFLGEPRVNVLELNLALTALG